jgi:hypothetical protein
VIKPAEFLQQVCSELIVVDVTVVASIVASPTFLTDSSADSAVREWWRN